MNGFAQKRRKTTTEIPFIRHLNKMPIEMLASNPFKMPDTAYLSTKQLLDEDDNERLTLDFEKKIHDKKYDCQYVFYAKP